jgi:thioredoxin reductase (NADPH)
MPEQHTQVLIIGAGPAGLTAALYAARAELKPLVVEGLVPGGQLMITTDVENYPGFPDGIMGPEIIEKFRAQAERFGTEFRYGMISNVDVSSRPFRCEVDEDPDDIILADTVIVATGADAKWLGLEDEKRLTNYGVSACATCDGAFFKGVEIGVVGGGDTAAEEALFLTRYGTKVHLVVRRDELRASKIMAHRVENHDKIEVHWKQQVSAIQGSPEAGVTGVTLKHSQTGEETQQNWNALFIAIGHKPNSDLWKGILDMDDAGYILTQPNSTYTNVPGIFACGDVQDPIYRQAVTAAGSGCGAAIDAERWMEAQHAQASHG